MPNEREQLAVQNRQLVVREETIPARMIPASTAGRHGTAAVFYMGIFGLLPTVAVGMTYEFLPLVPLIVLPFATLKASTLATTRHAAYEDVPPAVAAFNQSLLIWFCLALSFPVIFAFDVAQTVIAQLFAAAFVAALGPGVAAQWGDLPRQIYVPVQPSPPVPDRTGPEKVIAGAEMTPFEKKLDEQLDYFANKHSVSQRTSEFTDADYESF